MVRLGIGLYGFVADAADAKHIKNVAVLKSKIAQLKTIPKGDTVGYGRRGLAKKEIQIATLPIGYADGISRRIGNGNWQMKLNGKDAPTIGTICMDMCMIDVTGIDCKEDDEVFIFYDQKSTYQLSNLLQTIPYEILSSISPRVKRLFLKR
jgi:alanine racemase